MNIMFFESKIISCIQKPLMGNEECSVKFRCEFDCDFDYGQKKYLHIDAYISMRQLDLAVRSSFSVDRPEVTDFDTIFVEEDVKWAVHFAFSNLEFELLNAVDELEIKDPDMVSIDTHKLSDTYAGQLIEQYKTHIKVENEANWTLISTGSVSFDYGVHQINIVLQMTFIILDDIFWENNRFRVEKNKEAFENVIPWVKYETLKNKCLKIVNEDVYLSVYELVFFMICMDCAGKVLATVDRECFQPGFELKNVTDQACSDFLKFSSDLFANIKSQFKEMNVRIENLNRLLPWQDIIKLRW